MTAQDATCREIAAAHDAVMFECFFGVTGTARIETTVRSEQRTHEVAIQTNQSLQDGAHCFTTVRQCRSRLRVIAALSASRAPEVQFLMRLRDAAVNGNTFSLAADEYRPHAAYAGLIVDNTLDGTLLFSDGVRPGFVEFGDTVGLLRYLTKLLKSMQSVISSGDAG